MAISNVSTDEFDYTSATSGTANGTDGAYIPAFDITSFSDTSFTVNPPTTGDCQIISIKAYIDAVGDDSFTVIVNGDRENGAGENDALNTRVPPSIVWWDASSSTVTENKTTGLSFSKTANFDTYTISGGDIGTFGEAICMLLF